MLANISYYLYDILVYLYNMNLQIEQTVSLGSVVSTK